MCFFFSAITDTCMAMGQWVDNPHAETALSNILPCVDQATTNDTLYKSKLVVNDITNIINGFIGSFANSNAPPGGNSNYYNQSGPLMPYLCYPYDSQLHELECPPQLVSMANASVVREFDLLRSILTNFHLPNLCEFCYELNP